MIVVDLETSGLTPERHSILSIGAVDFEMPTRRFYRECRAFTGAHIDSESLKVSGMSKADTEDMNRPTEEEALREFLVWFSESGDQTICGQNPAFDIGFLESASKRYHVDWPHAHRAVDLHSVAYADMRRRGIVVPLSNKHSSLNLDNIAESVGLTKRNSAHNALLDALLEAECFSRIVLKSKLLPEYEKYPLIIG